MSHPISTLPTADEPEEDRPELEVDDLDTAAATELEVDEPEMADGPDSTVGDSTEKKGRSGFVLLVLAGLLLGSIAINLKQSRDVANLAARSSEYEQALAAAVERIDSETARANGAEAALDRVDGAVDLVNERVLGLQEALDGLREATLR
ncbi:MAG: hypothetical protein ACPGVZ_19480 [Myxococcota bacterium]